MYLRRCCAQQRADACVHTNVHMRQSREGRCGGIRPCRPAHRGLASAPAALPVRTLGLSARCDVGAASARPEGALRAVSTAAAGQACARRFRVASWPAARRARGTRARTGATNTAVVRIELLRETYGRARAAPRPRPRPRPRAAIAPSGARPKVESTSADCCEWTGRHAVALGVAWWLVSTRAHSAPPGKSSRPQRDGLPLLR